MRSDLEIKKKRNTKSFDILKLPPQHKIISTLTSITNVGKREVIPTSLGDANKQIDSFFWHRAKIQKNGEIPPCFLFPVSGCYCSQLVTLNLLHQKYQLSLSQFSRCIFQSSLQSMIMGFMGRYRENRRLTRSELKFFC